MSNFLSIHRRLDGSSLMFFQSSSIAGLIHPLNFLSTNSLNKINWYFVVACANYRLATHRVSDIILVLLGIKEKFKK